MSYKRPSLRSTLLLWLASVTTVLSALWGAAAIWYQFPANPLIRGISAVLWLVFAIAVLTFAWRQRLWLGLGLYALAFLALAIWWNTLAPSNNREWADDVAQMTTGTIAGSLVTLKNVRNFDWRTATDYTPRWETRQYDLDKLASVDMVLSYWGVPAIAHTLVSFGFENGEHVVFSVEIRKEKHESFSEIGGFFKEFELSVVAADERDIIRVRTNARDEDDYLYRVKVSQATMRSLFLAYVGKANSLVDTPRFYNTVTANCTTIIFHMMNRIIDGLPMDYRLVLSGYLPGYIHDVGALEPGFTLEALRAGGRITERAHQADQDPAFSAAIRRGVPGWDASAKH